MTKDCEGEPALVPMHSSPLSRVNSASLAQRGVQDVFAIEQAEQCFREASELWLQHEDESAVKCLMRGLAFFPLHVESRDMLGDIYASSPRVLDYKKAFEHRSIAAHLGCTEAQSAIAYMYSDGEGVAKDDQKAFFWMEKAARQGHHPCNQRRLGLMFEHGIGVERNLEKAAFWYQQAADQGGYFERSEMTVLQKQITGINGGYCKPDPGRKVWW